MATLRLETNFVRPPNRADYEAITPQSSKPSGNQVFGLLDTFVPFEVARSGEQAQMRYIQQPQDVRGEIEDNRYHHPFPNLPQAQLQPQQHPYPHSQLYLNRQAIPYAYAAYTQAPHVYSAANFVQQHQGGVMAPAHHHDHVDDGPTAPAFNNAAFGLQMAPTQSELGFSSASDSASNATDPNTPPSIDGSPCLFDVGAPSFLGVSTTVNGRSIELGGSQFGLTHGQDPGITYSPSADTAFNGHSNNVNLKTTPDAAGSFYDAVFAHPFFKTAEATSNSDAGVFHSFDEAAYSAAAYQTMATPRLPSQDDGNDAAAASASLEAPSPAASSNGSGSSGEESGHSRAKSEVSVSSSVSTSSGLAGLTESGRKVRSASSKRSLSEKDKKFICSYPGCNKAFSRNFNLSTHYNTHLGVKPFECPHCTKSFSRRHDCTRHVAAVHAAQLKKACNCNCSCLGHKEQASHDADSLDMGNLNDATLDALSACPTIPSALIKSEEV